MWNDEDIIESPDFTPEQRASAHLVLEKALSARVIDSSLLKQAFEQGANPNRPVFGAALPLHIAIEKGDFEAAQFIADCGADINAVSANNETALDVAIRARSRTLIAMIQNGDGQTRAAIEEEGLSFFSYQERVDLRLKGQVSLRENNRYEKARTALLYGASPDAQPADHSHTHLLVAVAWLDVKMAKLLLDAGADIHRHSVIGQSALDMLWSCRANELLTPKWYEMLDFLWQHGCRDLFFKRPDEMSLDDMRRPVPYKRNENTKSPTNFIHVFAEAGRFDVVLAATNPAARLTKEDFIGHKEFLITMLARENRLKDVFTPAIWQGRLSEMKEVYAHVDPYNRSKIDFDKACREVLEYRRQELLRAHKASPGITLKKGPKP